MASLEVRNVSKRFAALTVLNDISLTAADGEFLVLLGPSGCGKSTLLNMIAHGSEVRLTIDFALTMVF